MRFLFHFPSKFWLQAKFLLYTLENFQSVLKVNMKQNHENIFRLNFYKIKFLTFHAFLMYIDRRTENENSPVIGLKFWANPTPTNKYEYIMTKENLHPAQTLIYTTHPNAAWIVNIKNISLWEPLHKQPPHTAPAPIFKWSDKRRKFESEKGCFSFSCDDRWFALSVRVRSF